MSESYTSYILGLISLFFYSIVYLPQFILIYKTKSSNGISIWMLILWTQADALSLFGTLLLYLPSSFIIIGWYHFLVGVVLIKFTLFYRDNFKKNHIENYSAFIFVLANIITGITLNIIIKEKYSEVGSVLGWVTMTFYLVGRFPQLYMNWYRKSTEGLSLLMYVFTIIGNSFYIGVIIASPYYLMENIPWLIAGSISILLDIIIISQHYYYKRYKYNTSSRTVIHL